MRRFIQDGTIAQFSPALWPIDSVVCRFVVSPGSDGSWVVADRMGQCGGVFTTKDAARHFVLKSSFGHPEETEWLDDSFVTGTKSAIAA